jgi:membrane fusion protein, multidrug efflux system
LVEGVGKAAFVFILKADQKNIERRQVKVAFLKDGSAYVTDGLNGVTHVITSGSGFLTESSVVKISAQ